MATDCNSEHVVLAQCLSVEGSYKHQRDFGVYSKFDYLSLTVDGIHTTAFGYADNLGEMGEAVLRAVSSDAKIKALEQKYVTYGNELKQSLRKCLKNFTIDKRSVIAIKMKNNKLVELERKEAQVFRDFIKRHQGQMIIETGKVKEIKGVVANRGTAQGIVKIVLSSKDFYKVNPGDILVTTMTSVDFVPVMEKTAAFVTNEGGITSHAAIVAREMNKPCIIGTKIATQVLKDGDQIAVDAEKGIVTIL